VVNTEEKASLEETPTATTVPSGHLWWAVQDLNL
jgi:hypothetical protein